MSAEAELADLKNRVKRLEMENKDLSFKLQTKTKQIEDLQEENKSLENNLNKASKGMISELISDLNAQLTKIKAQNKKLKETVTQFENLGDIETKIRFYTSELEQKERTIGELRDALNSKKVEFEALNKKLELLSMQKPTAKKEEVDPQEILKRDEKIKELDAQIVALKTQIDFANQENDNLNQELENLKNENMKLKASSMDQNELLEARKKIASLNTLNSNLNLKIMSLEQNIQSLNKNIAELQKNDAEKLLQEKNSELILIKNDLTNARLNILNLNKKIKELETENERLKSMNASGAEASQNLVNLQKEKAELERRIAMLVGQIESLKQEISDSSTQKMTLRVRELKSYIDKMKRENKELQIQLNNWRKKVNRIETF